VLRHPTDIRAEGFTLPNKHWVTSELSSSLPFLLGAEIKEVVISAAVREWSSYILLLALGSTVMLCFDGNVRVPSDLLL
jgi:hypothetical protein